MKRPEASLQFVGGAGAVTGSKHWLRVNGRSFLLDCGLFQGLKPLRLRNWAPPPFEPAAIDAVILSHAHIDPSGHLPLLVRRGFRGPVHCTPATADQEGAQTLRIHGEDVPVRATIETLDGLSAHADREEILRWLGGFRRPPRRTYVVHGEPDAAQALAATIRARLGWSAQVAREAENVVL
jgi:Cft2 family RNA processing exonuclease